MSDAPQAKQAQAPSPAAEGLSAPYWNGTREGKLVIQKCADCGLLRHYPQVLCTACHSDRHDWVEVSGKGTVHSWTISHHAFHPGFAGDLPYALVTVDLAEGVRALGRWAGGSGDDAGAGLRIDLAVHSSFEPRDDGYGTLTFHPV